MIELDDIDRLGENLCRPECVLATSNGRIYAANVRGGITIIAPDGSQSDLLASNPGFALYPNGMTLMADGSVLLAHLGADEGGVFRLRESGDLEPFLTEVDGQNLPPTNYVHLDPQARIWITVSTRLVPRARAYRPDIADGFVVLAQDGQARVVAEGLGYANECIVHPDGKRLFVNETFAKRLTSFDIADNGDLTNRTVMARFGDGTFPDGLTFDAQGGVWITSIVSNRVIRISPDGGRQTLMIEDNDPEHVRNTETAFRAGGMGRPHLDRISSKKLKNISSLAFGGPDLRRIYLGCLLGENIYSCQSPVCGHPPSHWNFAGPQLRD
ncbi:hypothetical protein MNBD_ALPHA09-2179 [hydrothermal vent metagenome]|uniref:SMP-30/Gluconolactonase/LRE-like region domain-containing protein n=1 Tax=hydrothermal vent metagenome TaxID=652676 RepID=A0A3B0TAB1_9ZZZZ